MQTASGQLMSFVNHWLRNSKTESLEIDAGDISTFLQSAWRCTVSCAFCTINYVVCSTMHASQQVSLALQGRALHVCIVPIGDTVSPGCCFLQ